MFAMTKLQAACRDNYLRVRGAVAPTWSSCVAMEQQKNQVRFTNATSYSGA
jgi:hypothetical protein